MHKVKGPPCGCLTSKLHGPLLLIELNTKRDQKQSKQVNKHSKATAEILGHLTRNLNEKQEWLWSVDLEKGGKLP